MKNDLGKWIDKLKLGDQSAFLPLYQKTSPGLFKFLLWKTNGNRELSEDILQESYVRFLVHLDDLDSTEILSVQAYLLRIVKNCLIDKVARAPQTTKNAISIEDLGYELSSDERAEKAVEMRELAIAMSSLNEKESEIIWLRDALGLSHEEVGERVGLSEQASRQAYLRAKKSLLRVFQESFMPMAEKERPVCG